MYAYTRARGTPQSSLPVYEARTSTSVFGPRLQTYSSYRGPRSSREPDVLIICFLAFAIRTHSHASIHQCKDSFHSATMLPHRSCINTWRSVRSWDRQLIDESDAGCCLEHDIHLDHYHPGDSHIHRSTLHLPVEMLAVVVPMSFETVTMVWMHGQMEHLTQSMSRRARICAMPAAEYSWGRALPDSRTAQFDRHLAVYLAHRLI